MRRLKADRKENKLRGQRGASLLFAFLFLLVASMVSAVIIAGATTATRRVHDDFGREQNYLTLESAAKILRDLLKDTTVTVTVVTGTDSTGNTMEVSTEYIGSRSLTVSMSNAPDQWKAKFEDVRMDMTIEKSVDSESGQVDCTIFGVIQIDGSDDNGQKIFLYPGSVESTTTSENDQERTDFNFNWQEAKLYTRKLNQSEDARSGT